MANRLPSWIFISLAMVLMGLALFPILRRIIGIDSAFSIAFSTSVMLLISGLMCGLTGMLLLVRRQPDLEIYKSKEQDNITASQFHACGLLIFTGVPLLNFLVCYYLWVKNRQASLYLDYQGREAICFQITLYLYLLLSLFMVIAVIGVFTTLLLLGLHLIATLTATTMTYKGQTFHYPANINIIARTPKLTNWS